MEEDAKTAVAYAEIRRLHGPGERVECLAFRRKDGRLVSVSTGGIIQVWDVNDRKAGRPILERKPGGGRETAAVALSSDGRWAAVADVKGPIHVLDLDTPGEPIRLSGHPNRVLSLALFVGDDDRAATLASGTREGTVSIWDLTRKGAPPMALTPPSRGGSAVTCLAFSRSGHLAVGREKDGVELYKLKSGRFIGTTLWEPTETTQFRVSGARLLARRVEPDRGAERGSGLDVGHLQRPPPLELAASRSGGPTTRSSPT